RTPGQGRGNFPAGMPGNRGEIKNGMKPVVVGNVTAVNGNSITVTSRQGGPRPTTGETAATPTPVVYTVDATNAVVKKNNATSTVASIAVGDMVMIQGTVSGTNVVATNIRDNVAGPHNSTGNGNENGGPRNSSSTAPAFVGNGQPVVAGKLVTVSGNSLTVTTASNITYTVDATSAKVLKGQSATTVSSLVIGDTVLVQGTVSGTSVTAATIIDRTNTTPVAGGTTAGAAENKQGGGFFSGIGQFFMHMFGF
ncbi:MAG: hypothetical protein WCO09_04810, partial [bacterium]